MANEDDIRQLLNQMKGARRKMSPDAQKYRDAAGEPTEEELVEAYRARQKREGFIQKMPAEIDPKPYKGQYIKKL